MVKEGGGYPDLIPAVKRRYWKGSLGSQVMVRGAPLTANGNLPNPKDLGPRPHPHPRWGNKHSASLSTDKLGPRY